MVFFGKLQAERPWQGLASNEVALSNPNRSKPLNIKKIHKKCGIVVEVLEEHRHGQAG
jgi:hypothetical protein